MEMGWQLLFESGMYPKQGWAHVEGGILGKAGELWDLVVALSTVSTS